MDADFYETDPSTQDLVLTSILKGMDVSTYEAVIAAGKGEFDPEAYVGTLENDGVDLAPLHNFEDKVDPALMEEVQTLKESIIAGDVEVTSYLDRVTRHRGGRDATSPVACPCGQSVDARWSPRARPRRAPRDPS